MIPRAAARTLARLAKGYPVVAMTGPRQSGKTTLARSAFASKPYVSLEDPDQREFATSDPRGFLGNYPEGAVLDEVQRCPELFSYLQRIVDERRRAGLFVLTGSQQFGLLAKITQSLAGRIGLLHLLPFSLGELRRARRAPRKIELVLFRGLYPPLYDKRHDPSLWYANYALTYLERDVRQLINVRELGTFQRFIRMCAARTGQLLNLSGLASDCGITHNTAKAWVSVLEASYIVFLLQPYYRNLNKRLVKTPKLYFYDPGLAAWLLGIQAVEQLATHSMRGALFETWVVSELLKKRYNQALPANVYFWRDRAGNEVDVLCEDGDRVSPIEIKSGQTITEDHLSGLRRWIEFAGRVAVNPRLVYAGGSRHVRSGVEVLPWMSLA
jgi:hypothetical protein